MSPDHLLNLNVFMFDKCLRYILENIDFISSLSIGSLQHEIILICLKIKISCFHSHCQTKHLYIKKI